ncbi:conserved hypothetical protein [Coccidioides posadasii str. Silveira]|uniref:HMG box domain-containing protein n=2 Tax=Coccidioides posadasii TaxID=199306 RepID=E9D833_COCPS|nr:conserved hypothetical protein [Coccidioides posadasii str. Silveira]KMM70808.1 hypothetical protein CPAG_07119 [Coccidioides posadasii RMSCC 3488]
MRLESCILLERLGLLTGMTDENGPGPEIRARALALMNQATSLLDDHEEGSADRPSGPRRVPDEEDYLDDESVGSAEDRPPTPEERPVRTKRNRKTEDHAKSHGAGENNADSHMGNSFTPVASAQEQQHRYVSAFEDFTNRNRDKIASVLYRSRRSQLSDEDIDRAVIEHWEDLDPEEKREYGDRLGKRGAI